MILINTVQIDYAFNGFPLSTVAFAAFMKRGNNMSCKPVCKLCRRLVISNSVTFVGGNLVVNIPAGAYNDDCKYCIVIAQAIPLTVTINAPVVITIDTGTVLYPLVGCECAPVTDCGVRTRTRYSVVVETTATGGVFKMLGKPCCSPDNSLTAITGVIPVFLAPAIAPMDVPIAAKVGDK